MKSYAKHSKFVSKLLKLSTLVIIILSAIQILLVMKELNDTFGKEHGPFTKRILKTTVFQDKKVQEMMGKRLEILFNATSKSSNSRTPDVMLIGTRYCGTEALAFYLQHHPLVRISQSEIHVYDKHRKRGLKYYRSVLPVATEDELIVEKASAYFLSQPKHLPYIIKRDCPGVKLILTLCDPVRRAYSEFSIKQREATAMRNHTFAEHIQKYLNKVRKTLTNKKTISDRLLQNQHLALYATGAYAMYVRRWMDAFPPDSLKIIQGESLFQHPGDVMESIQRFLSLPVLLMTNNFVRLEGSELHCLKPWWVPEYSTKDIRPLRWRNSRLHCQDGGIIRASDANSTLSKFAKRKLRLFYGPYNRKLYAMIGEYWGWEGQTLDAHELGDESVIYI